MSALASLASPQAVLDARDTVTQGMVLVDGISVQHIDWDARFGVDQDTASARITLSLPRPEHVQPNATVMIQGGHNDYVGTLFSGRLPSWRSAMRREDTLTLLAVGWTSLLSYRERFDLHFDGPITISALFDALCARRGVPAYQADPVLDPTGSIVVEMGSNPNIDDGKVTVPASTTPLAFLRNAVEPYGYRVYDTPDGTVRLSRVSGVPNRTPVVTFTEGWSILGAERDFDISDIINYPDIQGQTYEDQYGASVPIRAFPAEVTASPHIPVNEGVSYRSFRNSYITTLQQAEVALAVAQIDLNAPHTPVRWDGVTTPGLSVGDAVTLDVAAIEGTGTYWLMAMRMNGPSSGTLTTTYDGWAGTGEATPPGNDATIIEIQTSPIHLGNETLSHYAVASPSGTNDTWSITIPDRATAVNVRGWHHGTNSQVVGGVQTELEVTRWQVWEVGADFDDDEQRPVASGYMPSVPEELALRRPYSVFTVTDGVVTDPGYWTPFAINLGRLDPGTYTLRLVCGEKAGPDDFEIRLTTLEVYGTAEPVIVPEVTT